VSLRQDEEGYDFALTCCFRLRIRAADVMRKGAGLHKNTDTPRLGCENEPCNMVASYAWKCHFRSATSLIAAGYRCGEPDKYYQTLLIDLSKEA
jgi:hypothetical protein